MSHVEPKKLKVDLSGEVRERLAADAAEQEASINDVAVGILADYFGVRYTGTGRRGQGATRLDDGQVILRRLPASLARKIHIAAIDSSKREVVEYVLRDHYSLDTDVIAA